MLIAKSRLMGLSACQAVVYSGGRIEIDTPIDQLAQRARATGTLVWLDVNGPCEDDIDQLQAEFSLHPLAVEDIRRPQQRPKVDVYDGALLVVLFDVGLDARVPVRARVDGSDHPRIDSVLQAEGLALIATTLATTAEAGSQP